MQSKAIFPHDLDGDAWDGQKMGDRPSTHRLVPHLSSAHSLSASHTGTRPEPSLPIPSYSSRPLPPEWISKPSTQRHHAAPTSGRPRQMMSLKPEFLKPGLPKPSLPKSESPRASSSRRKSPQRTHVRHHHLPHARESPRQPSPRACRARAARARSRIQTRHQTRVQLRRMTVQAIAWMTIAMLLRWFLDGVMAVSSQFWLLGVVLAIAPATIAVLLTQTSPRTGLKIAYRCLLMMLGLLLAGKFGGL